MLEENLEKEAQAGAPLGFSRWPSEFGASSMTVRVSLFVKGRGRGRGTE